MPANDDLGGGGGGGGGGSGGDLAMNGNDNCRGAGAATLSHDVQPILSARCAGLECHGNFFMTGHTYANLVGKAASECMDGRDYVSPSHPESSYVYQKITGTDLCSGVAMPRLGTPLGADEIRTIHDWICNGAQNN
jgi:hypothetical protein